MVPIETSLLISISEIRISRYILDSMLVGVVLVSSSTVLEIVSRYLYLTGYIAVSGISRI